MKAKNVPSCKHHPFINCENHNRCTHCGWNPEEHSSRVDTINNGGLQEDYDGLKRLHIKTKEDPETDAD